MNLTMSSANNDNNMILMTLSSSDSRITSPMTPSPSREIKGIRLFRAISRKLARRSNEDLNQNLEDADSRSSSTDSCSSTSAGRCSRSKKEVTSSGDSGFRSVSPNHMSSSSSEAGSDIQSLNNKHHRHHHSTSAESIRKVFQNLSLNTRSHSCNNTKETKRKSSSKKSVPTKRILRSPVTYTYVKGLSGLPTQRIPKTQNKIYLTSTQCSCNFQYMSGLNR